METIEDAFTQFFGYESTLNFTTFKHDFCGLLQYLDHIFESNEFKNANYTKTNQNKRRINPQAINDILGQYPMYIAELSTPIEITGRSTLQSQKHRKKSTDDCSDDEDKDEAGILELPSFLHFHYPELNQLFFTPQQTILLFGTFTAAIYEHVQKLKNEPKISSDEIFQQLANELSIEKEHLIKILSKCHGLVFNGHRPRSSHNLIYTSPATGTSTLYSILSILFHHLNIPFAYLPHCSLMVQNSEPMPTFDYSGFYYAPKQSQNIRLFNDLRDNQLHQFPYHLLDQSTIILMDNKDETYHFDEWDKHRSALFSHTPTATIFTFGTAEDQMIKNEVKYNFYLYNSGIYPYYYSPSMLNFKLGITQLQLNLQQLMNEYQTEFEQLLISISKTTTQQMSLSSTPITNSPQINQILQSQLINNPKYYPLLYNIIYHPMSDILATKQSMIISTRDTKEILSTIINDIQIDDINQVLLSTLQTASISESTTSTLTSKSESIPESTSKQTTVTTNEKLSKPNKKSKMNTIEDLSTKTPPTQSSSISKLPSLYLVPKSTNISNLNIDTKQFNNTTLLEQYWKQFQSTLLIDSITSESTTSTQKSTQIQSKQQSSQLSSSLYTLIHNLWFDLSIFTLYGLPTHRFVSLLASKPNRNKGQYSHMISNREEYKLCQILPQLHISKILLNGPKHFYQSQHAMEFSDGYLPSLDRSKRFVQQRNYFNNTTTMQKFPFSIRVAISSRPSYNTNWINNIIAFSERFDCYLPFQGFNSQPITKVISYNSIYGFQQPISSMIEQCDPETPNDEFDAQVINSMRNGVTIIIPPSKYKYADVIIKQQQSILFIRFGEFSSQFEMEKAIITKNYNYEYLQPNLYQTNIMFDNHRGDFYNALRNFPLPAKQFMNFFTSPSIVSESSQITSNTNPISIQKVVEYTKVEPF